MTIRKMKDLRKLAPQIMEELKEGRAPKAVFLNSKFDGFTLKNLDRLKSSLLFSRYFLGVYEQHPSFNHVVEDLNHKMRELLSEHDKD